MQACAVLDMLHGVLHGVLHDCMVEGQQHPRRRFPETTPADRALPALLVSCRRRLGENNGPKTIANDPDVWRAGMGAERQPGHCMLARGLSRLLNYCMLIEGAEGEAASLPDRDRDREQ